LHGSAFLFADPNVMSTDSWTRLTQSSRWGSFQARYRLCLVETRLAPRLAGSDSPPRSHVPWNGSRRADNPDTLLCQVSDASLQAPIRLLESTIPLTGPVALTGPPRFITAEASGCVFGTRTSPPRMVGENRQVYRLLVRFEAHAVERLAPYFTPAPVVVPGDLSVLTDRSCSSQLLDGASGLSLFIPSRDSGRAVVYTFPLSARHRFDTA